MEEKIQSNKVCCNCLLCFEEVKIFTICYTNSPIRFAKIKKTFKKSLFSWYTGFLCFSIIWILSHWYFMCHTEWLRYQRKLMICISIPEAFLASRHAGALACCLHTEAAVMLHARDDNSLCETWSEEPLWRCDRCSCSHHLKHFSITLKMCLLLIFFLDDFFRYCWAAAVMGYEIPKRARK